MATEQARSFFVISVFLMQNSLREPLVSLRNPEQHNIGERFRAWEVNPQRLAYRGFFLKWRTCYEASGWPPNSHDAASRTMSSRDEEARRCSETFGDQSRDEVSQWLR